MFDAASVHCRFRTVRRVAMNVVGQAPRLKPNNPRIIIVEADNVLASALADSLTIEGYIVEKVDRGDEAVERLADAPPDLTIVDWMLPGMSGPEICTRLRADGRVGVWRGDVRCSSWHLI
jgi:CheY-like chemotaxis protein